MEQGEEKLQAAILSLSIPFADCILVILEETKEVEQGSPVCKPGKVCWVTTKLSD